MGGCVWSCGGWCGACGEGEVDPICGTVVGSLVGAGVCPVVGKGVSAGTVVVSVVGPCSGVGAGGLECGFRWSRSDGRPVGEECRCRWSPRRLTKHQVRASGVHSQQSGRCTDLAATRVIHDRVH